MKRSTSGHLRIIIIILNILNNSVKQYKQYLGNLAEYYAKPEYFISALDRFNPLITDNALVPNKLSINQSTLQHTTKR